MPYDHLEEIQSRKSEKIAMFLTLENAFGLILVAFPAYLISAALPFALRILIVFTAAALGVLATLELGGMTFYERVLWSARGLFRRRLQGERITPAQLVGAAAVVHADRPLLRGGPIRRRVTAPALTEIVRPVAVPASRDVLVVSTLEQDVPQ
jgi:hypothetical protein